MVTHNLTVVFMYKLVMLVVLAAGVIVPTTLVAAATATPTPPVSDTSVVNVVTQYQQQTVLFPSPTPGPERSLFITDDRSVVRPGEHLVYRVVIRNARDADLSEATLTVRVPEFFVPSATQPGATEVDPAARRIRWSQQTISAGAEVTFNIQGTVQPDVPDDFVFHTVADVSAPGVRLNAEDSTTIERLTAITPEAAVSTSPTAVAPTVGVTARTGATGVVPALIAVLGGVTVPWVRRFII